MSGAGRKTDHIARKFGPGSERGQRERELARIAGRQHEIIRGDQLRALGLGARGSQLRVRTHRLHRLYPGVYAYGRPDVLPKGRWLAAVYACGTGAALSHRAAAALHGLISWVAGTADVTIPTRSGRAHDGIRIHRPRRLDPADVTEVDGIPCTTVARTLLDLAATEPRWLLAKAINQAEIEQVLDMRAIAELADRHPRHPGARRLRRALGNEEIGTDRTKSPLERRFLKLCRKARLPHPAINEWMAIEGEELQCDFVWHAQKVIVEVDGWETHKTKRAFVDDRRRARLLLLAGWTVLRFTWAEVKDDPAGVAADVAKALAVAAV
jgi:very-short-patch-repair endonuclease